MKKILTTTTAVALTLALAGCGGSASTTTGPAATTTAPWPSLVACLKQHPLFDVQTGAGINGSGSLPSDNLHRNIAVWQNITGHVVGQIGDYGTSRAAHNAADGYNHAESQYGFHASSHGALVYQWTQDTSSLNRADVLNCIGSY